MFIPMSALSDGPGKALQKNSDSLPFREIDYVEILSPINITLRYCCTRSCRMYWTENRVGLEFFQ